MPQKSRPDPANGTVISADEYEGMAAGSAEDGMIGTPGNQATVYADGTGRQVKIRAGRKAMVRGYTWWSDPVADEVFDNGGVGLPANTDANPRIDRLVLRLTRSTRQIRAKYLQGVPAAVPQPPALTQVNDDTADVWDFPLAKWNVPSGYTTVRDVDLTYEAWYRPFFGNRVLCRTPSRPFGAYTHLGMEITDYDTETILRWDGGSWAHCEFIVPRLFARRTNDWTAYIGTNLRDDSELVVNVKPNAVYTIASQIVYASDPSADFKHLFLGPAGSQIHWNFDGINSGAAGLNDGEWHGVNTTHGSVENAGGVGALTRTVMRPSGLLITDAAGGPFKFQWAQNTQNNTYGTQVFMGSWMELTRRP